MPLQSATCEERLPLPRREAAVGVAGVGGKPPTLHVLLIEDNPDHAVLIQRTLQRTDAVDVVATSVDNLAAGLDKLEAAGARAGAGAGAVDLILTDLHLPDCDGIQTVHRLHQAAPETPVVVLTSLDDAAYGRAAVQVGAADFLVKNDLSAGLLGRTLLYSLERSRIEADLRATTARLARSNQDLESYSRLVSHDLKTPLAVIRLELEAAEAAVCSNKPDAAGKVLESVFSAREEVDRSVQLIEGMLSLGRVGSKLLEQIPIHLNGLIADVVERLGKAGLLLEPFKIEVQQDLPKVSGAPLLLGQLVENLLGNAYKYRSRDDGTVRISGSREGRRLRLMFCDNGVGIQAEDRERVLKLFGRVGGSSQTGSGVGLNVAHRIVELHGGSLLIGESDLPPGTAGGCAGASISFTLPLTA